MDFQVEKPGRYFRLLFQNLVVLFLTSKLTDQCVQNAVIWNSSLMHSGLILLTVLNISRARFLSCFTLFIDLPDSFETHNHCKSCCKVFY